MAKVLLDEEVITELRDVMADQFAHLCSRFEADARSRLAAIEGAVYARDSVTLKEQAHSLKGASGNLGAQLLSDQCQQMETFADSESWAAATQLLDEARATFSAVEGALARYLS